MLSKVTICLISVATILFPTILSADTQPPSYPPKVAYQLLAHQVAAQYGVQYPLIRSIISCESSWNTQAHKLSRVEDSWGLVQINLKAHKDITKEQAIDPNFAINFLVEKISTGQASMWACAHVK